MNLRRFPLSIHDLHELGFSKMEEEHLFFDLFSRSARRRSRARSTITQTLLIQVYGQQYPTSVNDMCRSNGSFWHSSTTRPSLIPTSYNTHCFVPDVSSLPLFSSYVYSLEIRSGTATNGRDQAITDRHMAGALTPRSTKSPSLRYSCIFWHEYKPTIMKTKL
jgi:hypothetical protein